MAAAARASLMRALAARGTEAGGDAL